MSPEQAGFLSGIKKQTAHHIPKQASLLDKGVRECLMRGNGPDKVFVELSSFWHIFHTLSGFFFSWSVETDGKDFQSKSKWITANIIFLPHKFFSCAPCSLHQSSLRTSTVQLVLRKHKHERAYTQPRDCGLLVMASYLLGPCAKRSFPYLCLCKGQIIVRSCVRVPLHTLLQQSCLKVIENTSVCVRKQGTAWHQRKSWQRALENDGK